MINIYDQQDLRRWVIRPLHYSYTFFPGGEPHVVIEDSFGSKDILIDARLGDANDFLLMLAINNALYDAKTVTAFIPYFPGARQDRREQGSCFTAELYAMIVNRMNLNSVIILDPHSDVITALLDKVLVIPQTELVPTMIKPYWYDYLVCPDAGAVKKSEKLAEVLKVKDIIFCRKNRNVQTGKLSGFYVPQLPDAGRFLLADDICDGGGTFIGLAEDILNRIGSDYDFSSLDLLVTHGIFSKPIAYVSQYFDKIYTTDSFPSSAAQYVIDTKTMIGNFHRLTLVPELLESINRRLYV